jgi:hypothetical protein
MIWEVGKRPNRPYDSKTDAITEKSPYRVPEMEIFPKNQALTVF